MKQVKNRGVEFYDRIASKSTINKGEYFVSRNDGTVLVVADINYSTYSNTDGPTVELIDAVSMRPVRDVPKEVLLRDDDNFYRVKDTCLFEVEFVDSLGVYRTLELSAHRNKKAQGRVTKYAPFVKSGRMTVFQPGLGPTGTSVVTTPMAVSSSSGTAVASSGHVDDLEEVSLKETVNPPNLIASKTSTGAHLPVLDIDFPIMVQESDTPGHYHLFMEKPMLEDEYFNFLDLMVVAGVIEEGYAKASKERGASFVRIKE